MNLRIAAIGALAAGCLGSGPALSADAYSFTTINNPYSPNYTFLSGVDNSGLIVGQWSQNGTGANGFLYDHGAYSLIPPPLDYPMIYANGVNTSGIIVGTISPTSLTVAMGFIDNGGVFSYVNEPDRDCCGTAVNGINDAGTIVGVYGVTGNPSELGFIEKGGKYTTISDPYGSSGTSATGINNNDEVVGYYQTLGVDVNKYHGFIFDDGVYTTIDDPFSVGSFGTRPAGINDLGEVVGTYGCEDGGSQGICGFTYVNGAWSTVDEQQGIVGTTTLTGVNNAGEIVGNYSSPWGSAGFVATPVPEPSTWTAIMLGMGGLGLALRANRRPLVIDARPLTGRWSLRS